MHGTQMVNQGGRILELDLLRGIAIILMITGHSILVHPVDFTDIPSCQNLHDWIYSFHMELFFLISGCVYKCSNYGQYITKKIDRILIPMIVIGFIAILFSSFGGDAVNRQTTMPEGIKNLFLSGKPYWFLYALFVISLIFPLIERIFKNIWGELVLATAIILMRHFVKMPELFQLGAVSYYLPYFIFGHGLVTFMKKDRKPVTGTVVSILCLILYVWLWKCSMRAYFIRYIKAFAMMITFFFLTKLLIKYESQGHLMKWVNDFLRLSSKYSLQLYLFNGFVLVASRILLCNVLHLTNPAIVIPLIVFANCIVTLPLCECFLSKTKWLGWLCGINPCPLRKQKA